MGWSLMGEIYVREKINVYCCRGSVINPAPQHMAQAVLHAHGW
jgi:hypothetical protein